jgi:hypothetical protein
MYGFCLQDSYRKYYTTQRSSNTSFCNHYMRIAFGTSYRIRRWNLFVEHRSNYYFYFCEQREYLYSDSDWS